MIIDVSEHFEYNFTRDIELDNTLFRLIFNYNEIHDFWTLEIQDLNFSTLWIGKLVCNFDLLHRYKSESMPKGRIIAESTHKNKKAVRKDDFNNKSVVLKYVEAEELHKKT